MFRLLAPYAHTLWDAARGAGLDDGQQAACLGRAVIGEEDVSVAAYLTLLHRARQHAGPLFGWRLGQQVKPTTYGVNGILLLACPTLGEALQQVLRFESLVHDLGRSSFTPQGDQVVYVWRNDCAAHPAAGALVESVFAGIQTCAQWLVGKPLGDVQIEFMHRIDDATAAHIAQCIVARVRGGAAMNPAVFPAAMLDWPIPQANQALLPLLQRRLADAGLAYQMLLDTTRHELACHYLSRSAMPIAEVAYLLGFQDPTAFHHAFRCWQGHGPGQYRTPVYQEL